MSLRPGLVRRRPATWASGGKGLALGKEELELMCSEGTTSEGVGAVAEADDAVDAELISGVMALTWKVFCPVYEAPASSRS